MKEEELKQWLDFWHGYCRKHCIEINCIEGIEKCKQAYKQFEALIKASKEITEENTYQYGIRMTLRHMSDLMRAWKKYKGIQTLGEFAIEILEKYNV